MSEVKIGAVKLELVPDDGRYPEHLTWKRALDRAWAGEWGTLAGRTGYRYRMALDPSFYYERPEYRRGQLHYYEWILCQNGGLISLYSTDAGLGKVWTSKVLGEKILAAVPGTRVFRTSDEFLCYDLLFPLEHLPLVCRLAGAAAPAKAKRSPRPTRKGCGRWGSAPPRGFEALFRRVRWFLSTIQRPPQSEARESLGPSIKGLFSRVLKNAGEAC